MVLIHYVGTFAPAIGSVDPGIPHPAWEDRFIHSPLFFAANGYVAVYLFFLISGTVLTFSYSASQRGFWAQMSRRVVRLGLPMAAAVLLAALLFALLPRAHDQAGQLLRNGSWLLTDGPNGLGPLVLFREILLGGLLLGHSGGFTLFPALPGWLLPPIHTAPDEPLWSLHAEFYGSALVLLLVMAGRRLRPAVLALLCAALLALFVAQFLGLFVIGFIAAHVLRSQGWARIAPGWPVAALGALALVLGVCMSAYLAPRGAVPVMAAATHIWRLPMGEAAFGFETHYAAILLFFGVLALPVLRRALASRFGRLMGRYSFSLYLVHWPVLFTVTSALVVILRPLGHHVVIALASFIGLVVTGLLTVAFEKFVDAPATDWSRRV